jgi:signal transduction histidine kinase
MSYENPTDLERDMHAAAERLREEISTLRCLVTGLCQHVKATGGQEALDAVIALTIEEVKATKRAFEPEGNERLVPILANGFAVKR